MTIENEELDEAALFNDAVGDEPEVNPEPQLQIEQLAEAKTEIEAKKEAEAESDLTAEKPAVDDNAPMVPSFRLKQEADARRLLETDLANERADKAALRQRLEALEKPTAKVEEPKASKPDPLLDPDGYEAYLEAKVEAKFLNDRRETSLQAAHKVYKAEFEEAYAAAQKQVDPALRARMQQSRDPGETLMQWHREEKAKAEVGTDLTAYKAKLRDEALKDPEFRKAAMEAWRADAQPLIDGRPRIDMGNKPLMAPSLNGASRSNAALRSSQDDVSDAELFAQTTG